MPPITNKIHDVFIFYKEKIQSVYSERESQSILYLLFESLFHISRLDLCLSPDRRLSESEIVLVYNAVEQLMKHKPIQYVIGKTEFFGLPFFVNNFTLIPRPETEELVQHVLKFSQNRPLRILDIGTGSGAIAIAIKKQLPHTEVFACDVSVKALETAEENARLNRTKVHFFKYDILNDFTPTQDLFFDIIVSNPPYIPQSEKVLMNPNVLHFEPQEALFVPDDTPLVFYEAIAKYAQKSLTNNGTLFFEIHEKQGDNIKSMLSEKNYKNISIKNDLFGKPRFVIAFFEK